MALYHRPFREEDRETLEPWRREYPLADLELPHGYDDEGEATETVVITRADGSIVLSLTGTACVAIDPLLRDPDARPEEVAEALRLAEAIITYNAARSGIADAYIAVPEQLERYHRFLEKRGYEQTAQVCLIFRKKLVQAVTPAREPEPVAEIT